MACWTSFSSLVDQHIAEYSPQALELATVMAAQELGQFIGGFTTDYTGVAELTPAEGCNSARKLAIALPVETGFRFYGVSSVAVNGETIPRDIIPYAYTCRRYSVSECGTVTVTPAHHQESPTVTVRYTVIPDVGQVAEEMPEFLLTKYTAPMLWLILKYLSPDNSKKAAGYEMQYFRAAKSIKARQGAAQGIQGGRI